MRQQHHTLQQTHSRGRNNSRRGSVHFASRAWVRIKLWEAGKVQHSCSWKLDLVLGREDIEVVANGRWQQGCLKIASASATRTADVAGIAV